MTPAGRRLRSRFLTAGALGCGALALGLLTGGLGLVLFKGAGVISPAFLVRPMEQAGLSGGVRDQILGTVILVLTAAAVAAPLSLGVALLRGVYLPPGAARRWLTLVIQALNGVPSILFGLFGFFLFVKQLGWGKSWLAGGILLGMMILPTVALALAEGMDRIPPAYRDQAVALGLSRSQLVWSVLLPQSMASMFSGLLLGLARAAGETATILFTAAVFSGVGLPRGLADSPVLALPYHIFTLAQESYQPAALGNAWGSACVLVGIVVALSVAALPLRIRLHEEAARP